MYEKRVAKQIRIYKEIIDELKPIIREKNYTFSEITNYALLNFIDEKSPKKVYKIDRILDENTKVIKFKISQSEYEFLSKFAKTHGFKSVLKRRNFSL